MASTNLLAVSLIERDTNNDVLWVWAYPSMDEPTRELLLHKCTLSQEEGKQLEFSFGHIGQKWYYLKNFQTGGVEKLPKVTSFCVAVLAKDFSPEQYSHLAKIFGQSYLVSGSPVSIVAHYLSAYTKGQVSNPPEKCESYVALSYDVRKAYTAYSLRDVIRQFGIETVLVYNALLLKKRVVVYAPALENVLQLCQTLPLLVWHRQNWNVVYPNVDLNELELSDLVTHSTYIAGFTDAAVEGRSDLYDLFINVAAASVTVAPHAKDSFGMTKLHKDIIMHLMQCAQNDSLSDNAITKELSSKTKELLVNISSLAPNGGKITLDLLRARKLTPATENFLFSLAAAEGLVQM